MLLKRTPPIYQLIDEYAAWKRERSPLVAGAERSLLIRFCKSFSIRNVEDIQPDHILFFTGEQLTGFYKQQALKSLRGFLWYSRKAGYNCIGHTAASRVHLQKEPEDTILERYRPGEIPAWHTNNFSWLKRKSLVDP